MRKAREARAYWQFSRVDRMRQNVGALESAEGGGVGGWWLAQDSDPLVTQTQVSLDTEAEVRRTCSALFAFFCYCFLIFNSETSSSGGTS